MQILSVTTSICPRAPFMQPSEFCLILRPVDCSVSSRVHINQYWWRPKYKVTVRGRIITWFIVCVELAWPVCPFYYMWFETFKRHNLDKSTRIVLYVMYLFSHLCWHIWNVDVSCVQLTDIILGIRALSYFH